MYTQPLLNDSLRHANDQLKQIIQLQAALASSDIDLDAFMRNVVTRVQALTPASGVVVEIVDGDELVYRAGSGAMAGHVNFRIKAAASLSGLCVRTGEVLYSEDTTLDPRVDAVACLLVSALSMVVVPLYRREQAVGVLKVVSDRRHAFTSRDIETLQLMAELLGGALGMQLEMESRRQEGEHLRRLAQYDSLTGLPNRHTFEDRLRHALARNARNRQQLALMYMDIDHFKQVNDTYGHAAGDALLRGYADRIQETVRASDTFARLGGDEFVLIAEDVKTRENARLIAEKIIHAIGEGFEVENQSLRVGTSIGIALFSDGKADPDTLVRQADAMLYHAKKNGRNCYSMAEA